MRGDRRRLHDRSTKLASSKLPRLAIVGGESLLGRDLRELLSALKPQPALDLVSGEAEKSKMTRDDEGEAIVLHPMSAESLVGARAVILAGTLESSRKALELTAGTGTPLIDLTSALEDEGSARLRAPILEPAGTHGAQSIQVVAHPAAVALALFYNRIANRWPIHRSLVEVFEPASERGQPGLHELQMQTVNLLSFKPLPKDTFDVQVGFNLLPAVGTEAKPRLDQIEECIDRHLATLLLISSRAPMPSLRLLQAPVFHGYSFSVWVEFESSPSIEELERALASAQIEVRTSDEEPPSNVGAAGQSGLTAGDIHRDRNNPRAYWVWLVADNIRTFAETALDVVKEYL
jgi:aspartate-semialdehyde dehydrogenase